MNNLNADFPLMTFPTQPIGIEVRQMTLILIRQYFLEVEKLSEQKKRRKCLLSPRFNQPSSHSVSMLPILRASTCSAVALFILCGITIWPMQDQPHIFILMWEPNTHGIDNGSFFDDQSH
jgi:hypothetical protein